MDSQTFAHLIESSEDCNCSICEQYEAENSNEYAYENSNEYADEDQQACHAFCTCCEEVEVPENYKIQPTEIAGGSSYIAGGRRMRKVKRRKSHKKKSAHHSKKGGNVIGGKRKSKSSNPFIRFMKKHGPALRKEHPNASPQAIMKALGKKYRDGK
jgi:hypothetical protein